MTTDQPWCRVQLYNPIVVHARGRYHMWYIGNGGQTRTPGMSVGYATSADGLQFTAHPDNPVLTPADLPWGRGWQTPHVLYDAERDRFRMWVVASDRLQDAGGAVTIEQQLAYAESADGVQWDIHPEPLYHSGRRPCVIRQAPDRYVMWMNSAPTPDVDFGVMVANIYRFTSADGLAWTRDPAPAVTADDVCQSVVYPCVVQADDGYVMWYGCHVPGRCFQIYASSSPDGLTWTDHRTESVFPATGDPNTFDGRYTSTPCVLIEPERVLLYYCTRDLGNLYGAGDGAVKYDAQGIYRHIGVATAAAN
jgi:hypothetical protein